MPCIRDNAAPRKHRPRSTETVGLRNGISPTKKNSNRQNQPRTKRDHNPPKKQQGLANSPHYKRIQPTQSRQINRACLNALSIPTTRRIFTALLARMCICIRGTTHSQSPHNPSEIPPQPIHNPTAIHPQSANAVLFLSHSKRRSFYQSGLLQSRVQYPPGAFGAFPVLFLLPSSPSHRFQVIIFVTLCGRWRRVGRRAGDRAPRSSARVAWCRSVVSSRRRRRLAVAVRVGAHCPRRLRRRGHSRGVGRVRYGGRGRRRRLAIAAR